MNHEPLPVFVPAPAPHSPRLLPDHPVRLALLDLLAERGTVTSTQAAAHLGHSSGLCSFHLRQLARYGLIEEAPTAGGRARPWRLRWDEAPTTSEAPNAAEVAAGAGSGGPADRATRADFTALTRELENESYDRWLAHRHRAPAQWRQDESFSAVVYLTPGEAAELAAALRDQVRAFASRAGGTPSGRPGTAVAVAAVGRVFPLLTSQETQEAQDTREDQEPQGDQDDQENQDQGTQQSQD